jgi:hypothetical protein
MLGIKANDAILNNVITDNTENKNNLEENDRHYAPDFI